LHSSQDASDIVADRARNHLMLNFNTGRIFLQCYGTSCFIAGTYITPFLLRSMSARGFTTLCNLGLIIAKCMRMSERMAIYFSFTIPALPGVNGAAASALKGLQSQHAVAAGFGKGEFSAWTNNLRAFMTALLPMLLGNAYALLKRSGRYPGPAWLVPAVVGALIPELLTWRLSDEQLRPPAAKAAAPQPEPKPEPVPEPVPEVAKEEEGDVVAG